MISRTGRADGRHVAPAPLECDVNPLCCRVWKALLASGYLAHRSLHLCAIDSHIVIQGRLGSFYLRQIAIHCIRSVDGVTSIIDRIDVE